MRSKNQKSSAEGKLSHAAVFKERVLKDLDV